MSRAMWAGDEQITGWNWPGPMTIHSISSRGRRNANKSESLLKLFQSSLSASLSPPPLSFSLYLSFYLFFATVIILNSNPCQANNYPLKILNFRRGLFALICKLVLPPRVITVLIFRRTLIKLSTASCRWSKQTEWSADKKNFNIVYYLQSKIKKIGMMSQRIVYPLNSMNI